MSRMRNWIDYKMYLKTLRATIAIHLIFAMWLAAAPTFFAQARKSAKGGAKSSTAAKPTGTAQKSAPKATPPTQKGEEKAAGNTTGETVDVTAPDALDQIRAMISQNDRIRALEKFIVTQRGSAVQQARELLMREYTLRG